MLIEIQFVFSRAVLWWTVCVVFVSCLLFLCTCCKLRILRALVCIVLVHKPPTSKLDPELTKDVFAHGKTY